MLISALTMKIIVMVKKFICMKQLVEGFKIASIDSKSFYWRTVFQMDICVLSYIAFLSHLVFL